MRFCDAKEKLYSRINVNKFCIGRYPLPPGRQVWYNADIRFTAMQQAGRAEQVRQEAWI